MSKNLRLLFYIMIAITVSISLYDIYYTVLTIEHIYYDELNPIAKRIIYYGYKPHSHKGVANLVLIKASLLCIISVGTSIFHYSNSKLLHKIMFIVGTIYFLEHLALLGFLLI